MVDIREHTVVAAARRMSTRQLAEQWYDAEQEVLRLRELLRQAEVDARFLAHAYTHDSRPPEDVVKRALAYDAGRSTLSPATGGEGVIHQCPPKGSGLMPCCGRSPCEVAGHERMTTDPALVTCHGTGRKETT